MVNHVWSVLCQESIINSETNNVSLMNILERLNVNLKPESPEIGKDKINIPIKFEIVSLFEKDRKGEENFQIKVELTDPNGSVLKDHIQEVKMPSEVRRTRNMTRIQGLALTVPGRYTFGVSIKQKEVSQFSPVAILPLEVNISKKS